MPTAKSPDRSVAEFSARSTATATSTAAHHYPCGLCRIDSPTTAAATSPPSATRNRQRQNPKSTPRQSHPWHRRAPAAAATDGELVDRYVARVQRRAADRRKLDSLDQTFDELDERIDALAARAAKIEHELDAVAVTTTPEGR